jgi:TctA family transporter
MLEAFISGLLQVFTYPTFPLMLVGILIGFAVGILPGIGGLVTLALMLPFVFQMAPVEALHARGHIDYGRYYLDSLRRSRRIHFGCIDRRWAPNG